MIGEEDSDSGSEEELQSSSLLAPALSDNSMGNLTPKRAGCITAEVDNDMNEIMTEIENNERKQSLSGQWTRHRSTRYRDAKHPQGYEYLFCVDTGETKWVDENNNNNNNSSSLSSSSIAPVAKRMKEDSSININELSEGYIVIKGEKEVDYYCDQMKKWAFHTDLIGLELLTYLVRINQGALKICLDKMNSSDNFKKVPFSCMKLLYV